MEKTIYVEMVQLVCRSSAWKSLCSVLEDYKFLRLVNGRDNRDKVSDSLVHEKDSASWNKILLRIKKNGKI